MPNGSRRSQRTRAANRRRTRQASRRSGGPPVATATTATDPLSAADAAGLLHKGIVEGNPTIPLSLADVDIGDVCEEVSKIKVWDCQMDRAIKSLRKLKDDGIPEPLGRVLASTAVPASVAHTVRGHVLQGRPSAVIGLMDAISREFGDTCARDIADYIYELENWQCTQQHILEMLPQLEAAGVPEDVRYALEVAAHSHTTDGDGQLKRPVYVSDPASFAAATNHVHVAIGNPSFPMWREALNGILEEFSVDELAAAIEQFSDWGGTDEQAMQMLQAMRTTDVPAPIVEAFRKSACTSTTLADTTEQAELGLRCGRSHAAVPDIEPVPVPLSAAQRAARQGGVREAPFDPKTATRPGVNKAAWEVIDPEPQPLECSTCCYPFAQGDLFGCDTEQCEYRQCASCILKGKGGACTTPGCYKLHWDCPACTEPAGEDAELKLTDARFSKADVLLALDGCRRQLARANDDAATVIDSAMTSFVAEMRSVRRSLYY
eukprot:COSAG06_NODE_2729_length_6378_cov_1.791846_5_plen_491_part_00